MQQKAVVPSSLYDELARAPFTLSMSAGFFGFYAHAGALAALLESGLTPSAVTGSSAGALVTGLWAGGMQVDELRDALFEVKREAFWDPSLGPGAGLLRGKKFEMRLREMLKIECAEHARVPVRISVFDVSSRQTAVFDRGDLATLIHASCAFPFLFQPVRIGSRLYSDGGIKDRPGQAGNAHTERVLFHHLPSKSPWRRQVPAPAPRPGVFVVARDGLPRMNPFNLAPGALAFRLARENMMRALETV
jgi:NTE family protein